MFARRIAITLSFLFITLGMYAQGFLTARGKTIVDANGKEVILRGIGLGGWMLQEPYMLQLAGAAGTQHEIKNKIKDLVGEEKTAAFYDAWHANHCTRADIDSLAAWGFNSVRLPMHYNLYTLPIEQEPAAGQNTWIEKGFAMTDSLLRWCAANKIYLILDLHAVPGGEGHDAAISDYDTSKPSLWESEANRQKTIALWKKLAERYKDQQWIGGYDVVNEPNWGFENAADKNGCAETSNAPLKQLYTGIVTAIREADQHHIIIIEGNCWGNNYKGIFPFNYPNIVVSFHKYWNYNNEGAIKGFLETRDKYNVPVWVGESGENSNTWTTHAIRLLEDNKIGWAWWPLKKLGFNCPFEVSMNKGYENVINYWRGKSAKPSEAEAFSGLMQLAEALKVKNTTQHKDFIDAMFRQVYTTETKPYHANKIGSTALIYAADFDLGRNGYAYYDMDTANYRVSTNTNVQWNKGHAYRNDGADIQACTDSVTNGYDVAWTEPGEWLQYTIDVAAAGRYDLQVRASSVDSAGSINVLVNERVAAKDVSIPITGEKHWQSTTISNLHLNKGVNKMRIYMVKGGAAFNYLRFYKRS